MISARKGGTRQLSTAVLIIAIALFSSTALAQSWPNPGHPAGQVGGGTFNASYGNFRFPVAVNLTADSTTFHVDATGDKVSIGSTTPTENLDVTGNISVAPAPNTVALTVGRVSGMSSIKAASADGYLILDSNGNPLALNYYTNQEIWLGYAGGNVGVGSGMNGPDTALHVLGGLCVDTDAACTDPGAGNISAQTDVCIIGGSCLSAAGGGSMSNWIIAGDSGSETVDDGETATIAGSSTIDTSESGSHTNTVNISVQADSITDTELAYNTGQHLTTTSDPTHRTLNLGAGNITTNANVDHPSIVLDSQGSDDNWAEQGAHIAIGESADGLGDAAIYMTYDGSGVGYIGMGALSGDAIPAHGYFKFTYNQDYFDYNGDMRARENDNLIVSDGYICVDDNGGTVGSCTGTTDGYIYADNMALTGDMIVSGADINGTNGIGLDLGETGDALYIYDYGEQYYPDIYCGNGTVTTYCEFLSGIYVNSGNTISTAAIYARGGVLNDQEEDTYFEGSQSVSFNIDRNNDDSDTEYFSWRKDGAGFGAGTELMRLNASGTLNATEDFCIDGSGTCLSTSGTGDVSGTGSAEYIPIWSGTKTLTYDSLYWNSTSNKLGISTTAPTNPITVQAISGGSGWGGSDGTGGVRVKWSTGYGIALDAWDGGTPRWGITKYTGNTPAVIMQGLYNNNYTIFDAENARVGIGTTSPSVEFHVVGASILSDSTILDPDTYSSTVIAGNIQDGSGWAVTGIGGNMGTGDSWGIGSNGAGVYFGMQNGAAANTMQTYMEFATSRNVHIVPTSGNLGVGTSTASQKLTVSGNANITGTVYYGGNLTGYGSDFAEMFASPQTLEFGDVVCLDEKTNIIKCTERAQPSVAGVVSEAPTIMGNSGEDRDTPVGIVGILKTKVIGPVSRFEMLTTSAAPGFAEKATIDDFGAIIGKAMEPCNQDQCMIKVLVGLK
jgi:hypothetical protein